jgi:hypothetical protein
MGKMRLSFIDSDLLYRGAFIGKFDYICTEVFYLYIHTARDTYYIIKHPSTQWEKE